MFVHVVFEHKPSGGGFSWHYSAAAAQRVYEAEKKACARREDRTSIVLAAAEVPSELYLQGGSVITEYLREHMAPLEELVKTADHKCVVGDANGDAQEGVCPQCGQDLTYDKGEIQDSQLIYCVSCQDCGWEGIEWCTFTFAGQSSTNIKDEGTYSIIHDNSGEEVRGGFPSERAAYRWLRKQIDVGNMNPADIGKYSVNKEEEEEG